MRDLIRALGAAAVTAATIALPSTAWAAADEPAPQLVALTNAGAGDSQTYRPFQKGQSLPVAAGIANVGTAPVAGVVVDLYITGEMELPRDWTNCQYYGDDSVDGAWCEFDTDLQAATSYLLSPLSIAGRADASRIKYPHSLNITWYPKSYAAERGGIRGLARDAYSQGGREPVQGTEVALTLRKADLPVPAGEGTDNPRGSVAFYFVLGTPTPTTSPTPSTSPTSTVVPPGHPTSPAVSDSPGPTETVTTDPTPTATSASPSASPTGVPTAAPADPSGGEGGGGGLALTGSNTALVAGGGLVLLLAGAGGFLVARRRRTKFVA